MIHTSNHKHQPWSINPEEFELIQPLIGGFWKWSLFWDKEKYDRNWLFQLGYHETDILNPDLAWSNILHPEDKFFAVPKFEQFKKTGLGEYKSVFRLLCKNGQYKRILSRGSVTQITTPPGKIASVPSMITGIHFDLENILQDVDLPKDFLKKIQSRSGI